MKQYVIDEFRLEDYEKVKKYLDDNCKAAGLYGVYWMELPHEILTDEQASHDNCQPYYFALELEEERLSCGLLVRASANIRCHCIAYATVEQRNWLIDSIDTVLEQANIII